MDKRNNIGRTINHDLKKSFTIGTPPHKKLSIALQSNEAVQLKGDNYKVVSKQRIKGADSEQFFLKKIY